MIGDGLYVDGGVILRNPSPIGGTWACCYVENDAIVWSRSGVLTPDQACVKEVTNNQSEMYAMLMGLLALPKEYQGKVFSDSMITIGRVSMGWKWKNIPDWGHDLYYQARQHIPGFNEIKFKHLDGHPTKDQLQAGFGKRGNPVSKWNVWCDERCTYEGKEYMKRMEP